MGVKTETVRTVTCDICHKECGERDGDISIQVNSGDGRDVGPAMIFGRLQFDQPYGCQNGIICTECKIKYLSLYVREFQPRTPNDNTSTARVN